MKIAYTRAMVNAAIDGELAGATFEREPFFGLEIPTRRARRAERGAQPAQRLGRHARPTTRRPSKLAGLFADNFARFEAHAAPELLAVEIKP